MNKNILIIENFLNNQECDILLQEMSECEFANKKNTPTFWRNSIKRISFNDKHIHTKLTTNMQNVIEKHFSIKFKKQLNLHSVVWPTGKSMPYHKDYGAENEYMDRNYNSLVYLNDDYLGGELLVPSLNIKLKPKKGTLVAFQGGNTPHGVGEILQGTRYTVICWWELLV